MKKMKYKITSAIIILFIAYQIIFPICISNANDIEDKNIYDVILFWGQSNMTCYCGMNDYEKEKDTRYDYTNANSVKEFSQKTGIDEEILSNSIKMNYVKVEQEPETAYEYYYIGNELQELNENTNLSGEQLIYNQNTKKLETTTSPYSIQRSDGTTVIPKFCQEYYKNTGHKVVAVLASNGGEAVENFLPSTDSDYGDSNNQLIYEAMLEKYKLAVDYVKNEYGENSIGNKIWVSFQGDSNVKTTSTSEYKRLFLKLHNYFKSDFGITNGAIIETAHTIGSSFYDQINNIHNAQEELASENDDIIIGSRYEYERFIPDETTYNSNNFNNQIFTDSNGNKLNYSIAYNMSTNSFCYPDNLAHLTSAALSQIGKETAENLAEELGDKVAPQLQIEYSTTKKTNRNIIVTITANEEIKELEGWERSSNKKVLTKEYSENKIEEITVKDLSDNESKINVSVTNIDKVAPSISVIYSEKKLTNKDVEVNLISNEELQELEGWTLSGDKKTLKRAYKKNTEERVTIKDEAGNEEIVTVKIINIDKESPEIGVEYSTTNVTDGKVTVSIVSNKELQEIEGWTLSGDKKKLTKEYYENKEEEIEVYDTAGNSKKVIIKINNIDKGIKTEDIGEVEKNSIKEENIENKTLPQVLPFTGTETIILIIIAIMITIFLYLKNRKMKGIR